MLKDISTFSYRLGPLTTPGVVTPIKPPHMTKGHNRKQTLQPGNTVPAQREAPLAASRVWRNTSGEFVEPPSSEHIAQHLVSVHVQEKSRAFAEVTNAPPVGDAFA